MKKIMQDVRKKRQKEITDLESRSKPLYELVVTENFAVNKVIAESYATSFSPRSERIIGGRSSTYEGGFTSKLILKVLPNNKKVPIRTINFEGISIVKVGDHISAKIPRYEEKKIASDFHFHSGPYSRDRIFYFDRDFNPEESAVELTILAEDGAILRKDRAVDYKRFVKN